VVRPWETARRAHRGARVFFGEQARGGYGEGVKEDHRLFREEKRTAPQCARRERGATVRFDCAAAISPLLERRRRLTTGSSRRAPRTAPATRRSRRSRLAGLKKRARELAPRSPRPDHLPAQPVLARPRRPRVPRRSDAGTIVLSNSDLGGRSRFASSAVGSCFFGSCLALQGILLVTKGYYILHIQLYILLDTCIVPLEGYYIKGNYI